MSKPTVAYYMIRNPYPKKGATVVAIKTDGSTVQGQQGDSGFDAAYKRAQRANSNKKRGKG